MQGETTHSARGRATREPVSFRSLDRYADHRTASYLGSGWNKYWSQNLVGACRSRRVLEAPHLGTTLLAAVDLLPNAPSKSLPCDVVETTGSNAGGHAVLAGGTVHQGTVKANKSRMTGAPADWTPAGVHDQPDPSKKQASIHLW